jgi:hypothetical protein
VHQVLLTHRRVDYIGGVPDVAHLSARARREARRNDTALPVTMQRWTTG